MPGRAWIKRRKYNRIQGSERKCLERSNHQGASNAEIARILIRHKSTIGRELKRNMMEK